MSHFRNVSQSWITFQIRVSFKLYSAWLNGALNNFTTSGLPLERAHCSHAFIAIHAAGC